jgi:metal-sulfur cluster biosynthetic enzyme
VSAGASGVPNDSSVYESRLVEIRRIINEIIDPCSAAMSHPLGIVNLGLINVTRIERGCVELELVPTSPSCLFVGLFEEEIDARLRALPWVDSVQIVTDDGETIWDERRIAPAARRRLTQHRAAIAATVEQRQPTDPLREARRRGRG